MLHVKDWRVELTNNNSDGTVPPIVKLDERNPYDKYVCKTQYAVKLCFHSCGDRSNGCPSIRG